MKISFKYILIICSLLIAGGCHKMDIRLAEPNANLQSAAEFAHNNFAFSLFYAAIERAGMVDELNGPGPFTILAPTNAAFNQRGIYNNDDLGKLSPDSLRRLISRHILNGKHFVEDIPGGTIDNLYYNIEGSKLYFSCNVTMYQGNNYYVNGVPLTHASGKTDIILSNGLLHETNGLLNNYDGTLAEWLVQNGQYKIFIAGLRQFGYWPMLSDTSLAWTIFPPSDSVFLSKGVTEAMVSGLDSNAYGKRLFGVYLFPSRFFLSDLSIASATYGAVVGDSDWSNGYAFNTSDQGLWYLSKVTPAGDIIKTNWVQLSLIRYSGVDKDILTWNGTVQKIDQLVLLPGEAAK